MAVNLFFAVIRLSIVGSTGYTLLKLLAAASGNRLSQSWRYHGIAAVSLLFVLPVHRLWAFIPVPYNAPSPVILTGNDSELVFLPVSPTGVDMLSPQPLPNARIDWGTMVEWAAVLWLWVAIGLVLWNAWRLLRYRRLIEQANNRVNSSLLQLALDEARLAGIRGEVRLLASPLAQSPMLIGFFRPTILLPSEHLPDSDARFILAHELTHFRRKDLWKKLLVLMVRCIHWFNPIAYLLNRDFSRWLETSCDEYVVSSLDRDQRKEYGRLLINYAPSSRYMGPKLYVSFASCRYKLKRRISTMLNSNEKSRSLLGLVLALALVVGCLATSAMAATITESRIDRDDATLANADDLQVATVVDWAIPVDLARDGRSSTFCNLSDIQVVEDADWASLIDNNAPAALSDDGIMPLARGSLAPNKAYIYNSMSLTKGEVITLNASWSPSSASVSIGLLNDANSVGMLKPVSNGSGSAKFEVTESGNFSLVIANTSAVSIDWDMSYVIE